MEHELVDWARRPDAATFPYGAVLAACRDVGKHFLAEPALRALEAARAVAPADPELAAFLHTALDKRDGRFDNPSYLAIGLLPLPSGDDQAAARAQRDRLLAGLVAALVRFELAAGPGRLTDKRCHHALRVLRPVLDRWGVTADGPQEACDAVEARLSDAQRRTIDRAFLPVSTEHDEHLFVRVLQAYETVFAMAGVELRAAIAALRAGRPLVAGRALAAAQEAFAQTSALFSLIGTMRPEAFLEFRRYTDGASAIQSRGYKLMESLCRRPDAERLASAAFDAVPEVRDLVRSGLDTLEDALAAAQPTDAERHVVEAAMAEFEGAVDKWRRTHHSVAVRMLGVRRGTGGSAGVPYLAQAREHRVFTAAAAA